MTAQNEKPDEKKKRLRLLERIGGFPVLLLALAGILLLLSGNGLLSFRSEKSAARKLAQQVFSR